MKNISLAHRGSVAMIDAVDKHHCLLDDSTPVLTVPFVMHWQACSATTARRVINRLLETEYCYLVRQGGRGVASVYALNERALSFVDRVNDRGLIDEYKREFSQRRQVRSLVRAMRQYPVSKERL